jgi:hypothetical protein
MKLYSLMGCKNLLNEDFNQALILEAIPVWLLEVRVGSPMRTGRQWPSTTKVDGQCAGSVRKSGFSTETVDRGVTRRTALEEADWDCKN